MLENEIIIALVILGFNRSIQRGNLLDFFGEFLYRGMELRFSLGKVLGDCVFCSSSSFGLLGFIILQGGEVEWVPWLLIPLGLVVLGSIWESLHRAWKEGIGKINVFLYLVLWVSIWWEFHWGDKILSILFVLAVAGIVTLLNSFLLKRNL